MATKNTSYDEETLAAIYRGVTQDQLMRIFKMDHRTIKKKLFESGVKPVGKSANNADIYAIIEIAPYLVKPIFDVETYIKQMNHADLPKHLTKEFWAGLRSKQDYEERAGHLWRTEKVVEKVGELMKLVKMGALLMNDAVERQTELSERQRAIIKELSHGMLADLMNRINEQFQEPSENVQLPQAIDDETL
jgi:hypothetical protein